MKTRQQCSVNLGRTAEEFKMGTLTTKTIAGLIQKLANTPAKAGQNLSLAYVPNYCGDGDRHHFQSREAFIDFQSFHGDVAVVIGRRTYNRRNKGGRWELIPSVDESGPQLNLYKWCGVAY